MALDFAAINCDGSNRAPAVRTRSELAAHITDVLSSQGSFGFNLPAVVSLSEVSGAAFSPQLVEILNASSDTSDYHGSCFRAGNNPAEHLALLWDQNRLAAERGQNGAIEHFESRYGRYISHKLACTTTSIRTLTIAVHLPHRAGRQDAYRLLAQHIERDGADCDAVAVIGDYNAKPARIMNEILPSDNGFQLCVPDGVPTTTTGSTIDNVAVSEIYRPAGHRIRYSPVSPPFHHCPLLVKTSHPDPPHRHPPSVIYI